MSSPKLTLASIHARPVVLPLKRPIVARIATITEWPLILIALFKNGRTDYPSAGTSFKERLNGPNIFSAIVLAEMLKMYLPPLRSTTRSGIPGPSVLPIGSCRRIRAAGP
jgi:hypothetical protein